MRILLHLTTIVAIELPVSLALIALLLPWFVPPPILVVFLAYPILEKRLKTDNPGCSSYEMLPTPAHLAMLALATSVIYLDNLKLAKPLAFLHRVAVYLTACLPIQG